jgi:hypothetical protein
MGGFLPGKRFDARKDQEKQMLVLELSDVGCRIVSRKLKGVFFTFFNAQRWELAIAQTSTRNNFFR